ncbi:hypothetical protein E2C01_071096 [Portunus trituberculatus]|uniref:Uncharacterized protein n=1 Tax=Portunus trituberculatus TaxID=210409 RepID=A0A5B7HZ41_PORTR|nr:hypothetical protein [Portunus trituberculatus]
MSQTSIHCPKCSENLPKTRSGAVYGMCPCYCHFYSSDSEKEDVRMAYPPSLPSIDIPAAESSMPQKIVVRDAVAVSFVGSLVACAVLLVVGVALFVLYQSGAVAQGTWRWSPAALVRPVAVLVVFSVLSGVTLTAGYFRSAIRPLLPPLPPLPPRPFL